MNPIDVYILTGYLGAGKTTTLNRLLDSHAFAGKKLALIINEFGKMGVDGQLVSPGDYAKFEINKGSIFCICTKTDFLKALDSIENDVCADALVIESTGIAETIDIESIFAHKHLEGKFRIRANICLADAVNFTKTAAFLKAVTSQVRSADIVILNKTDMAEPAVVEQSEKVIAGLNSRAPIIKSKFGDFDLSMLDEIEHIPQKGQTAEQPPADVVAVSIKTDKAVNRADFMRRLEELGESILRLKGNVRFETGVKFVEVIAGDVTEKVCNESLSEDTAFTVIGWKMTGDQLRDQFAF